MLLGRLFGLFHSSIFQQLHIHWLSLLSHHPVSIDTNDMKETRIFLSLFWPNNKRTLTFPFCLDEKEALYTVPNAPSPSFLPKLKSSWTKTQANQEKNISEMIFQKNMAEWYYNYIRKVRELLTTNKMRNGREYGRREKATLSINFMWITDSETNTPCAFGMIKHSHLIDNPSDPWSFTHNETRC